MHVNCLWRVVVYVHLRSGFSRITANLGLQRAVLEYNGLYVAAHDFLIDTGDAVEHLLDLLQEEGLPARTR